MMNTSDTAIVPVTGDSNRGRCMVKTHFVQKIGLLGFMVLMTLPAWAEPVASEAAAEPDTQRAACDAKCREENQSNAAALQACLRACGAIGPASGGAIVAGPDGTTPPPPAESINLNSSRSNVYRERGAADETSGAAPSPPTPVEAANLNLSKSNINREAEGESSSAAEDSDGDRR